MSDSERAGRTRWSDRRAGRERRSGAERRMAGGASTAGPERRKTTRRTGQERRDDSAWQAVPLEHAAAPAVTEGDLLGAAAAAREFAHAHYSGFRVGAALETLDGTIVTGCNIENATYGLTMCAERVALFKALSEGHTAFTRIAVVADQEAAVPPCGSCRQLLWEYGGDLQVILGNLESLTGRYQLIALLPLPFDRRVLVK